MAVRSPAFRMLHLEKTDRIGPRGSQLVIELSDWRAGVTSPFLSSLPHSQLQICLWLQHRCQVGGWHHGYRYSLVDGDESAMQAGGGPPGFAVAMTTTCCSGLSSASLFSPTTQTILTNDGLRHFQKNSEVTRHHTSQSPIVGYLLDKPIHRCVCRIPEETTKTTLLALKLSYHQRVMSVTLSKGNELRISDLLLHAKQNKHVWISKGSFSQNRMRNMGINRITLLWQKST